MMESAAAADHASDQGFVTRSVVFARHGMVAAAHPLAVQIGVDILEARSGVWAGATESREDGCALGF